MNNQMILTPIPLDELFQGMRKEIVELLHAQLAGINPQPRSRLYERPITEKELCDYFRISAPTAIRWRSKGKIPYMSIGSAIRYNLADVEKALESKKR